MTKSPVADPFLLIDMLKRDVDEIVPDRGFPKSESARRAYVRAVFAYLEGTSAVMREASLHEEIESIRRGGEAQLAKLALLAELDFEVGENGDVRTKKLKARLLDFVLFSLRSFATALGSSYEVKKGDDWHRVRRAVEIRDRLTHPKTADDFIVSDDDLECVHFAKDWFHAQLLHMGGFKRIV